MGDAVLDLLVGEFLFRKFPNAKEGELSKLRACIVNEKGFMKLAKSLDLGAFCIFRRVKKIIRGVKRRLFFQMPLKP